MLKKIPTQIQSASPDDLATYLDRGKAAIHAEDWPAAIAACQQAINLDAGLAPAYDLLGKAYAGQGSTPAAITAFQRAMELDPTVSWYPYELGRCWMQLGDWDAAVTAFQGSIALKPDFEWAYYHLGELLLDQEDFAAAIEVYQQGIACNPDQALFYPKLNYAEQRQAQQPMTVDLLLAHPPKLHDVFGKSGSLGISTEILNFLNHQVTADSQTLETGAGITTLLFALKGATHTCIVPDAELVDRIRAYCQRGQISTERLTFQIERSETVLPQLAQVPQAQSAFDLVLIDGRHAFPSPFIDWYYGANLLSVNGLMIIDDTQLWTGEILKNFLTLEPEWDLMLELPESNPNSAIFKILQEGSHDKWWLQQPYAVQQAPQSVHRIAP